MKFFHADDSMNDGNFYAILRYRGKRNDFLKFNLENDQLTNRLGYFTLSIKFETKWKRGNII